MLVLNHTLDLTDICRTFYPTVPEYTFFAIAHITFSRIDHMRGDKTSLSNFEIEIIPSIKRKINK